MMSATAAESAATHERSNSPVRPPRLWPAWLLALATVGALVLTVSPSIANAPRFYVMAGWPLLGGLLFLLWLVALSRLSWREKGGMLLALAVLPAVSLALTVPNYATRSLLLIYGSPLAILLATVGLTLWASHRGRAMRTVALMAIGWAVFPMIRNEGFDGDYFPEVVARWRPLHEDGLPQLVATRADVAGGRIAPSTCTGQGSWLQFRGPAGNGVVDDQLAGSGWQTEAPREIWRIPIGPGWSSFSYHDGRLFTQEQRGSLEYVCCYCAEDGRVLWSHGDETRFEEVVSGAGPRGTPSVADGRVYAMGARALLNCLDEATGEVIWQRDFVEELSVPVPTWGFSGSPAIVDQLVVIYVGGAGDQGLIAVDGQTGQTVWGFPSTGENYTTARRLTLGGSDCLVFCDSAGVHALDPPTGEVLWSHRPEGWQSAPMVDAQQLDPSSLLVALGDGVGMCRLQVELDADQWRISQAWTTSQLRPSFNDSLILDDLIFGFNQHIFSCIDARTGRRLWHGGRFGFGQAILLKNSATLVLAAEKGDAVILRASGDKLEVIQRLPMLHDKTWNHPILVGNRLYMRNGKVAVCLELAS